MNKFTVDLGDLKLSAEHVTNINAAIQKAVAGELAKINPERQIVLIPVSPRPSPKLKFIINGIIAREFSQENLKQIGVGSSGGFAEFEQ